MRRLGLAIVAALISSAPALAQPNCRNTADFGRWLADFKREALAQGISPRALEAAAPYPVWGALFYGLAAVVLVGVAARRPGLMILGHLAFAALYLGRWETTHVAAEEAYAFAVETRQPVWAACAQLGRANLLTKHPLTPSDEECARNPASRSARLRAVEMK